MCAGTGSMRNSFADTPMIMQTRFACKSSTLLASKYSKMNNNADNNNTAVV